MFVLQNLRNFVPIKQPRMRKWEGENGMLHQDLVPLHVKTLVLLSKINNTPIAMADLLQAMGCYDVEILLLLIVLFVGLALFYLAFFFLFFLVSFAPPIFSTCFFLWSLLYLFWFFFLSYLLLVKFVLIKIYCK